MIECEVRYPCAWHMIGSQWYLFSVHKLLVLVTLLASCFLIRDEVLIHRDVAYIWFRSALLSVSANWNGKVALFLYLVPVMVRCGLLKHCHSFLQFVDRLTNIVL